MSSQPNYEFIQDTSQLSISINCTPVTDLLRSVQSTRCKAKDFVDKTDRIIASREFHTYIGTLMKVQAIDSTEFLQYLRKGLDHCKTTVTTHLLYMSDIRGMNRADLFEQIIPLLIQCKPGTVFFQTLVRGLVRQDSWRLICSLIRDDIGSKVNKFIFETLECHIRKHNRKCLRSMPRQGRIANRIRGYLKIKPAKWRHVLAGGSRGSITSFMSNNDWKKIDYRLLNVHILIANYRAFMRHDHDRFHAYIESHPEIDAMIKKIKNCKYKYYPSQKEIYDTYVVPMREKEDNSCQK